MANYSRCRQLDEALTALAAEPRVVVAGGTDFYPARVGKPLDEPVLDITGIQGLRGIEDLGDHYRIGALTTWTDVLRTPLAPLFDGLKLAAREVGGIQVQNAGTLVGNVCNASPAADGIPNWLALEARVELASVGSHRSLSVAEFVTGNRRTRRERDELVTALLVPKPAPGVRSHFLKLGARHYLVISIVMVSGLLIPDGGRVAELRVAVGSCSAVARRQPLLEAALRGRPLAALEREVTADLLGDLSPIDDCRATADYRREAALILIRRLLRQLAGETLT